MKRFIAVLAGTVAVAALVAPSVATAAPRTGTCDGNLRPGTYHKLVIPAGATCIGDGPVRVLGGLFVESGATFVLGSEESSDTGTITGGVHSADAASVQIHFATIKGGVDLRGGSGPFTGPFGVTWNTIEDSHVSGGVRVSGYDGFWMGFIRNHVNGTVTMANNVLADPDGNEYVTNSIHGSFKCWGNSPAPQVGDSQGDANQVTGAEMGQCAGI